MFSQNQREGLLATLSVYRRWLTLLLVVVCVMTYSNILYSGKDAILFEKTKEEVEITQVTSSDTFAELAPCGEVCSYSGTPIQDHDSPYQQIRKDIDCVNIMKRMAYTNHSIVYPPPKEPPHELYKEFTQYGKCPISNPLYYMEVNPNGEYINRTYERQMLDTLVDQVRAGINVNLYNNSTCMMEILAKHRSLFAGRSGLVVGTQFPWLESMLLAHNAGHVTTLEYGHLALQHPSLEVSNPYEFADNYLKGETKSFEFAVTFSSIEHSGLGRYGDPLNPYGDLEAMAQVWCMLQPGGTFIVAVPGLVRGNECYIQWNAHRVYGPDRLSHLAASWNLKEMTKCEDMHVVLVLEKPKL